MSPLSGLGRLASRPGRKHAKEIRTPSIQHRSGSDASRDPHGFRHACRDPPRQPARTVVVLGLLTMFGATVPRPLSPGAPQLARRSRGLSSRPSSITTCLGRSGSSASFWRVRCRIASAANARCCRLCGLRPGIRGLCSGALGESPRALRLVQGLAGAAGIVISAPSRAISIPVAH